MVPNPAGLAGPRVLAAHEGLSISALLRRELHRLEDLGAGQHIGGLKIGNPLA